MRAWSSLIAGALGFVAGALFTKTALAPTTVREGEDPELERLLAERERQWQRTQTVVRGSAHDIRNPLTTIRARAELLKRSLGNGHSGEVRHVDAILRSSQRLEAMVTQLSTAFREGTAEQGPALEPVRESEPTPS